MKLRELVWKSLRQHSLSSIAAIISLSLGIALMTAVLGLRTETQRQFTRVGLGIDAIAGPKGSALQVVLNAIYHLEEMPGRIPWSYIESIRKHPVVKSVVPFCTGHSFAGIRVNAMDGAFFQGFEIQPGRQLSFDPAEGGQGRAFASGPVHEAVIGWEAAKTLGVKVGDEFSPTCGVNQGERVHDDDHFTFVGILGRTGTPHDRAIYIPLESFFSLGGHSGEVSGMENDLDSRVVSGAFVKIRRIRGDVMHPGIQDLKFSLRDDPRGQLVIPNEVLPSLFRIIGWIDQVLLGIAGLVVGLASLFLFVSLLNALRERRRDYALLRCLGARRRVIFGLVLSESSIICSIGGILGIILGHFLMLVGAHYIKAESGVDLQSAGIGLPDFLTFAGVVSLGLLTGLIPAIQAYRQNVLENLAPTSL